jgi:hypothetical protein
MLKTLAVASILQLSVLVAGLPEAGQALASRYDAMDVEHHWLAGQHVAWRTGDPDSGKSDKSHCSAFVAATCERLGIYILRPPEHGQVHLATAQADWLRQEGGRFGWKRVDSPATAQELANQGKVVVAAFGSQDPDKPGHIALVRPFEKPASLLDSEGPQVTQAGMENAASASLKEGFRHHRRAWVNSTAFQVEFYCHDWHP